ncbi:MAG: lipoprotein [Colwellia sp.]
MKKILFSLFIVLSVSGCAGLGVATVGAVMYYKSQNHEVASVDIEASSTNVYNAVVSFVEKKLT